MTTKSGAMLLRQGTPLPRALALTTQSYFDGWRWLHSMDRFMLDRRVRDNQWRLFFIAGRMSATVLGRGESGIRRAAKQIARRARTKGFNCLELTTITNGSFLGIPFLSLTAYSYHIQEGEAFDNKGGLQCSEFSSGH